MVRVRIPLPVPMSRWRNWQTHSVQTAEIGVQIPVWTPTVTTKITKEVIFEHYVITATHKRQRFVEEVENDDPSRQVKGIWHTSHA